MESCLYSAFFWSKQNCFSESCCLRMYWARGNIYVLGYQLHCRSFSLYLLSALMINMWIVWFPGRLDPHKVGLSASKESKLTISHSSPHFNNNTSTALLELQSNRSIQINLIWKFYISLFLIRVKVFLDLPSLLIGAPKFCILVLFDQVTDCYYNVFKVY